MHMYDSPYYIFGKYDFQLEHNQHGYNQNMSIPRQSSNRLTY